MALLYLEHELIPPGFPVLTSKDTACGAKSTENTDVPIETWDVTAGTDVVALWDQWPIAHKGPILQYMAACPSCMFYPSFSFPTSRRSFAQMLTGSWM